MALALSAFRLVLMTEVAALLLLALPVDFDSDSFLENSALPFR